MATRELVATHIDDVEVKKVSSLELLYIQLVLVSNKIINITSVMHRGLYYEFCTLKPSSPLLSHCRQQGFFNARQSRQAAAFRWAWDSTYEYYHATSAQNAEDIGTGHKQVFRMSGLNAGMQRKVSESLSLNLGNIATRRVNL